MTVGDLTKQGAWAPSEYKDCLSRYGIPMLKIKRSRDGLIFNVWIPILVRLYWDGPQGVNKICTQSSVFHAFGYTHTDANILHTIYLLIKFQTYIYNLDLQFKKWYHSTNSKLNKLTYPVECVRQISFPFPASLCCLSVLFTATFLSFKVHALSKWKSRISNFPQTMQQ